MSETGGAPRPGAVLVLGIGNALRGDDAAGLEVLRAMRGLEPGTVAPALKLLEHEGEPLAALELWRDAAAVVLVDAVSSGAPPGSVTRLDASSRQIPAEMRGRSSTHAIGLGDAVELARALGRLPPRAIIYGLEGAGFELGGGLSEPVRAALGPLAARVLAEALSLARL